MKRIYFPGKGLDDWKQLLASPTRQWKQGYSAFELAMSWELAAKAGGRQLPKCVAQILDGDTKFASCEVLLALPEHKVSMPGAGFPSQTDLWALLKSDNGLMSLAVEGKAREPFGEYIDHWLQAGTGENSRINRQQRLQRLCEDLGICEPFPKVRYQLIHRAVSAVLEAKRYGISEAVLLVQCFCKNEASFRDFQDFAQALNAPISTVGELNSVKLPGGIRLSLGWVGCDVATDVEKEILRVTPSLQL